MSSTLFPTLKGLTWEIKFKDEFSNLIQTAAAPGFETRLSLGPDPIIHIELDYEFLRQLSYGASSDELATLRGFFRARRADFDSFLLFVPALTGNANEGTIAGQTLTPDANNIAPLVVTGGGYDENIYEAAGVNGDPLPAGTAAPVIKKDGSTLTVVTDYNLVGPGFALAGVTYPGLAVQFLTATAGHTMTADFSWLYRVRFEQSAQEFSLFTALLYSAQQVQLVTTRTS
jgi:hypothetical protein